MRNIFLFGLYFVLSVKKAFTEGENEIKRGTYPFMAILYYPDENTGVSGDRFTRSAVLIRPEWLISSSLETNDTALTFPRKTLVAKAGAISIDANFTFNEDEDEQEREIIQIIRPRNFSASPWWYNDITLLKTLLPFNMTVAVTTATLAAKRDYMDKTCFVLVYAKRYKNSSEEKLLMQLPVELLPSSKENCGVNFRKETMFCASDSDENKNLVYDPDFCYGNSGGPLLCDGDVIGIQTYIGNNCKQPYLYQSVSMWDDFISCGVEEKFQIQLCFNICDVIDKDIINPSTTSTSKDIVTTTAKIIEMVQSNEDTSDEEHLDLSETIKESTTKEYVTPTPTMSTTVETTTTMKVTPVAITENFERSTTITEPNPNWPKEKLVDNKNLPESEDSEKVERKTNVEAQRHGIKKKGRNGSLSLVTTKPDFFTIFLSFIYFMYF